MYHGDHTQMKKKKKTSKTFIVPAFHNQKKKATESPLHKKT